MNIGFAEGGLSICPGCYSAVKMMVTPNGIQVCPKCNYSPTLGNRIAASTAPVSQPSSRPSRDGVFDQLD